MINIIRAMPQGMFWYPLLLVLAISLVRAVAGVRYPLRLGKAQSRPESDHIVALANLVERARNDGFACVELERRCLAMLFQVSGYAGYSVENCRLYSRDYPESTMADAVQRHMRNLGPGRPGRNYAPAEPDDPVNIILAEIERITEVLHE